MGNLNKPSEVGGLKNWREHFIAIVVLFVLLVTYYSSFLMGKAYIWDDQLYTNYPAASYLVSALIEGRFPLWISGMRCGVPFYSDIQIQAFYPPVWLLAFFSNQGRLSFVAYQCYLVLHLFGAGFFIYIFLRANRLVFWAALAGMVTFVFSAFLSLHIIHPQALSAFAWLPAQLCSVKSIADQPKSLKAYYLLIFYLLMSFLAGFPQVVLYNTCFIFSYWLFLYFLKPSSDPVPSILSGFRCFLKEGVKIGGMVVVVILLSAALFIPAAENWSLSHRQQFGYTQIADESLPWYYVLHGCVPNFFGMSGSSGSGVPFWGYNKNTEHYATWHAGYWEYWEFGFYAGQMALIALVGLTINFRRLWKDRRKQAFFLFATLPIFLLMLGRYGGLFNVFYYVVPGFSMFRGPARIGCLLDICLAVIVAVMIDMLLGDKKTLNLKRLFVVLAGLYGVMIPAVLIYGDLIFPELKNQLIRTHAVRQVMLSFGLCVTAATGCWFINRALSLKGKVMSSIALVCVIFLDLYLTFHTFHQGRINPTQYYSDRNGLMEQMSVLRKQSGLFRFAQLRDGVVSEEIVFPRNAGYLFPHYEALEGFLLFDLKEQSAFNSLSNQWARLDIQNAGIIANLDSRTGRVGLMRYTNSLPRVKFYHALRAYPDNKALYADLNSGRLDYRNTAGILNNDLAKYNIVTSSPPATAAAEVHFSPKTPEEYQISYRTTAPGIIFVSESFYPGWTADGGKYPIVRAFGAFKGIVIPEAGSGVITVKFSPRSFKIGLAISLATLVFLVFTYVALVRRQSKITSKSK